MNAKVMTAMMSGLCAAGLLMSTQAFAFERLQLNLRTIFAQRIGKRR